MNCESCKPLVISWLQKYFLSGTEAAYINTAMKHNGSDFGVVNTHLSSSSGVVFNQPSRDGDLGSVPETSFSFFVKGSQERCWEARRCGQERGLHVSQPRRFLRATRLPRVGRFGGSGDYV
jgi:hypothetical protein